MAWDERSVRIKGMKGVSNRSRAGSRAGSYSFDKYGFVRKDVNRTGDKQSPLAGLSALDSLKTGKVIRIKH